MEQHNANRSWRPAASPDRPPPARTLIGRRGRHPRSYTGLRTCCIADFQIGRVPPWRGASEFGNPRHSRLGNLRHRIAYEISGGVSPSTPFCSRSNHPQNASNTAFFGIVKPQQKPRSSNLVSPKNLWGPSAGGNICPSWFHARIYASPGPFTTSYRPSCRFAESGPRRRLKKIQIWLKSGQGSFNISAKEFEIAIREANRKA